MPVLVFVAIGDDFGRGLIFVGLPVLGDGGHQLCRVAVVVPVAVAVFGCPYPHAVVVRNGTAPDGVGACNAKEAEILLWSVEALSLFQDISVVVGLLRRLVGVSYYIKCTREESHHQPTDSYHQDVAV